MGVTNIEMPKMDPEIMDATRATAKLTGQVRELSATHHMDRPPTDALTNGGEETTFHTNTGTPQEAVLDGLMWQMRPIWDNGTSATLSEPANRVGPCTVGLTRRK